MRLIDADELIEHVWREQLNTRFAIEALVNRMPTIEDPEVFEWCTDCKEYDQKKHCCHRWTKSIRNTIEEIKNYHGCATCLRQGCQYRTDEARSNCPLWKESAV